VVVQAVARKRLVFNPALLVVLVGVVQIWVLAVQVILPHNLHLKETMVVQVLTIRVLLVLVVVAVLQQRVVTELQVLAATVEPEPHLAFLVHL
jgi:hypothetical protein